MLIPGKGRQIHCGENIGNAGLRIFRQPHLRVFQHLIGIGEVRAVQRGNAYFGGIGEILHIVLAAIDRGERHSILAIGIEPCYQAAGIHHPLNTFEIFAICKQSAAVIPAKGKKMDESVRAIKNQVAAVDILRGPQNGKGVFLRTLPCAQSGDVDRSHRPAGAFQRVPHRRVRCIRVKVHRFFFLRKGQVIKSSFGIDLSHNPAIGVLRIGEGSYAVNVIDDLHLLFIVQHGPLGIMERQIKFHGIGPVDFAGDNNIKGIFQNRFPRAVCIQHYRACKAQLFIGGLRYIVELDFQQLRSSAGILSGKRHTEADILPVRRLQLAAGADSLPGRPFLQIIRSGGFHLFNGSHARCIFAGRSHASRTGKGAGCRLCNKLPAGWIGSVRASKGNAPRLGERIHITGHISAVGKQSGLKIFRQIFGSQRRIRIQKPIIKAACVIIGVSVHPHDKVGGTGTVQFTLNRQLV